MLLTFYLSNCYTTKTILLFRSCRSSAEIFSHHVLVKKNYFYFCIKELKMYWTLHMTSNINCNFYIVSRMNNNLFHHSNSIHLIFVYSSYHVKSLVILSCWITNWSLAISAELADFIDLLITSFMDSLEILWFLYNVVQRENNGFSVSNTKQQQHDYLLHISFVVIRI